MPASAHWHRGGARQ